MQPVPSDQMPTNDACVNSTDISKYIFLRNLQFKCHMLCLLLYITCTWYISKYYKMLYIFKFIYLINLHI
jgi:hypothetical protein